MKLDSPLRIRSFLVLNPLHYTCRLDPYMTITNYFRTTQLFIFFVLLVLLPLRDIDGIINVLMALSLIALIPDYRNLYLTRFVLGFWALFATWYLASSLWNLFPGHTYKGLRKEVLYSVICFIISFFSALRLKSLRSLLYAVLLSLTLSILASLADGGGVRWIGFMEKYHPSVGDGSTSLVFFFATALILFYVKKKYLALLAIIITVSCVGLALYHERRVIFITFAVMVIFYLLYGHKSQVMSRKAKLIGPTGMITFFLLSLIFALSLRGGAFSIGSAVAVAKQDPRIYMWDFYIDKGLEKPVMGYGAGYNALKSTLTFLSEFPKHFSCADKDHAHNVFLNKWLQMGIVGILLFVALYSSVLYKCLQSEFSDDEMLLKLLLLLIFAGFFVRSMTDDFFIRNNLLLFWLMTGFILGRAEKYALDKPEIKE